MQINKEEYKQEKASRENRLDEFNECVKKKISELSRNIISELVEEREKQGLSQKELADMIGLLPYNLARFETGVRIPTLIMLEKYASAVDKHIDIQIEENNESLCLKE